MPRAVPGLSIITYGAPEYSELRREARAYRAEQRALARAGRAEHRGQGAGARAARQIAEDGHAFRTDADGQVLPLHAQARGRGLVLLLVLLLGQRSWSAHFAMTATSTAIFVASTDACYYQVL